MGFVCVLVTISLTFLFFLHFLFGSQELLDTFSPCFDYVENISYPSISYGGASGSAISSIIVKPK